jgi:hypothetical protein
MHDDPYPARYYARSGDEQPTTAVAKLPHDVTGVSRATLRLIAIGMALYLALALFLFFTVASHAAPASAPSATIYAAEDCAGAKLASY